MSYVYDYLTALIDSAQALNTNDLWLDTTITKTSDNICGTKSWYKPIRVAFKNNSDIKVNNGKAVFNPKVVDITTVKDTVTIVTFVDGSQEKAVCREGDHFSIETGVTICLMKKMLQMAYDGSGKTGTNLYNNMVKDALKKKDAFKIKKQKAAKKEKEERAAKQKAREAERKKKRDNRDFLIDMLAEALKKSDCSCDAKKLITKE